MDLITAQDAHVDRILNMTPYSERYTRLYKPNTLLNRKTRSLSASRGKYINDLEKLGFDSKSIWITMRDAEDMAELEYHAD